MRGISTGSPHDLLTRTCTRSCKDPLENFTRISTRASHKDLYKIMLRPLTAFHYDPINSHKDLYKSMHCKDLLKILMDFTSIPTRFSHILQKTWAKIFTPEPLRESHNVVIEGPAAAGEDLARSWDKNLPRATQKGFHGSASKTWHLQGLHSRTSYRKDLARISTRSSDKDLYKIMLGPLREDFARISTRSSRTDLCKIMQGLFKDVNRIFARSSHKDLLKVHARTPDRRPWSRASSIMDL